MILIWSRFGILVPIFVFMAFVGSFAVIGPLHLEQRTATAAAGVLATLLSALAVFFTAHSLEQKKPRVLIDEATSKRIVVKPSAGHFFYIPMRYWPYLIAGLGLLLVVLEWTGQLKSAR